jgi:hypothetical protein
MTNWKAGMKAVCVEALTLPYQSLKEGAVYDVIRVSICRHNSVLLDVGVRTARPNWSGFTADNCGCRHFGNWKAAYRFRPLLGDEQRELDAIEEEVKEMGLIPA